MQVTITHSPLHRVREGYDRLLDLEKDGGAQPAMLRTGSWRALPDEKPNSLFAYDYEEIALPLASLEPLLNRRCTGCKRVGVRVWRRMATALLRSGRDPAERVNGAVLAHARTGQVTAVSAKAVILCTSRPAGSGFLARFPASPNPAASDHRRRHRWRGGWRAVRLMEKSVKESGRASRSYPPYSTGTITYLYACTTG